MKILKHRQFEGIDTISMRFFWNRVDPSKFSYNIDNEPKERNIAPGITIRTQKSEYAYPYGYYYYCDIQVEDTLADKKWEGKEDIEFLVKSVLKLLLEKRILIIPKKYFSRPGFVSYYGFQYYAKICALDFYFDFHGKNAVLSDRPSRYKYTRYSADHTKKASLICAYDKNKKYESDLEEKENKRREECKQKKTKYQKKYELIKLDAPMRIEFRLRSANYNPYLHIYNLTGKYQEVFWRYHGYLAKVWRKHGKEVIKEVKCDIRHENFYVLEFLSQSGEKIPLARDLVNTRKKVETPFNRLSKRNNKSIKDMNDNNVSDDLDNVSNKSLSNNKTDNDIPVIKSKYVYDNDDKNNVLVSSTESSDRDTNYNDTDIKENKGTMTFEELVNRQKKQSTHDILSKYFDKK